MAYQKINFKNLPSKTTPINAQNLNKMDNQIAENETSIGNLSDEIENLEDKINSVIDLSSVPLRPVSFAFGNHTFFSSQYEGVPDVPWVSNFLFLFAMNQEGNKPMVALAIPADYANQIYVYRSLENKWNTFAPVS